MEEETLKIENSFWVDGVLTTWIWWIRVWDDKWVWIPFSYETWEFRVTFWCYNLNEENEEYER